MQTLALFILVALSIFVFSGVAVIDSKLNDIKKQLEELNKD